MKVIFGCHGRLPGRTDCRYHRCVYDGTDVVCLLSEIESSRFCCIKLKRCSEIEIFVEDKSGRGEIN